MRVLVVDGEGIVTKGSIRFDLIRGGLYVIFMDKKGNLHTIPSVDVVEIVES
jgi:hypothetical protein